MEVEALLDESTVISSKEEQTASNHPWRYVWEPLPDKAGESTLLTRSGGEKGLRGGGAGKTYSGRLEDFQRSL